MRYFTLSELTATSQPYNNTPSKEHEANLIQLTHQVLDPLREAWGSAIRINSGYRSPDVNRSVGGVANSAHLTGYAADLYPVNGDFTAFKIFITKFFQDKKFDQVIIERNTRGSEWVHVGLYGDNNKQRQQIFRMSV